MDKVLLKINELYGLNVSFFERVSAGFLSENHILSDDKRKFFLKKYRFDNFKRVAEVHASKQYFADGGIPVILPLSVLDGRTFFTYNSSYYALFPFVNGKHLERWTLTDTAIVSLGEMLGRIHLLGRQSGLIIDDRFKIENKENTFKKIEAILARINAKDSFSDFDKIALENVQMKKELLLANTLNVKGLNLDSDHLIHGDYLDQNVFFDKDHTVQYVFDFEKTNYSPRTYELFRSMVYSFLSAGATKMDLEIAKKYLDAYSRVYPISKDEIRRGLQLFFLKVIHGFWVESEHYLKDNARVDSFLLDDHKRIKFLSKNLLALTDFLTT